MQEQWKDVKDYEGLYQVSNFGNVRNKEMILKLRENKEGYIRTNLCKNGDKKSKFVHRLVAEAFMPDKSNFKYYDEEDKLKYVNNLDKLKINHKDENKQNNNVENLEWCTIKYNNYYGTRIERVSESIKKVVITNERLKKIRETHWTKKIIQYDLNGNFIKEWDSIKEASLFIKKHITGIQHCCKKKLKTCGGYIWKYADEVK